MSNKKAGSSRRRGSDRSTRRTATPTPPTVARIWIRMPRSVKWMIAALPTSLGILTGVLSLLPQVSISAQDPLIPAEALTAPFIVTNTGQIPVHDVVAACYLNHVEGLLRVRGANSASAFQQDVKSVVEGLINLPFTSPAFAHLSPSQSATTGCNTTRRFTGPKFPIHGITAGEIIVDVGYTPWLLPNWQPLRRRTSTAFWMKPLPDGTVRWFPMDEPVRREYSVSPIDPFRDPVLIEEIPRGIYLPGGHVSIQDYLMPVSTQDYLKP